MTISFIFAIKEYNKKVYSGISSVRLTSNTPTSFTEVL